MASAQMSMALRPDCTTSLLIAIHQYPKHRPLPYRCSMSPFYLGYCQPRHADTPAMSWRQQTLSSSQRDGSQGILGVSPTIVPVKAWLVNTRTVVAAPLRSSPESSCRSPEWRFHMHSVLESTQLPPSWSSVVPAAVVSVKAIGWLIPRQ